MGRGTAGQSSFGKLRTGTGETRLRLGSETHEVPTWGWTGSDEPYKRDEHEVGESGAGVGAAHSTDDAEEA